MDLFKELIENGSYIEIGNSIAEYKMDKGSFSTKEKISNKHHLEYKGLSDGYIIYSDGSLEIKVKALNENDSLILKPIVDDKFDWFRISFKSDPKELFYGCGEQYSKLNLKGEKIKIWVSEHHNTNEFVRKFFREKLFGVNPNHTDKNNQTYFASPTFISSLKYFVNCDSNKYAEFNFKKNNTVLSFREIPQEIAIYHKNTFKELFSLVSDILGRQSYVPKWTEDGAIISIQSGTENVLNAYKLCIKKGVKLAGIWCQDWSGMIETKFGHQVFWNWEVDSNLYHDLKKTIDILHEGGVKFLGYINTFLKRDSKQYNEAKEKGYCVMKENGEIYHVKSTTFDAAIVDLTNPDAFNWYKNIIKTNMIEYGLDGWMADFGEYLPTDSLVYSGDPIKAHNIWPELWMRCNYEAVKECGKEKDVFYFNRSCYKTAIPYTQSMWCGDQHVDYSDDYGMGSVIPATISMGLSGVGITHSDIGGYTTIIHMKRTPELLKRWAEMNVFSPVFRCHEGNRPWSNAQYSDPEVIDHFALMSKYYSHLAPYNDYVREEYYKNGIPTVRPLFFEVEDSKFMMDRRQYMYGDDILVSPVLRKNKKEKEVVLPDGEWVQFFTGDEYKGGTYKVQAPIGRPIAFYKKDSQFKELFKKMEDIK